MHAQLSVLIRAEINVQHIYQICKLKLWRHLSSSNYAKFDLHKGLKSGSWVPVKAQLRADFVCKPDSVCQAQVTVSRLTIHSDTMTVIEEYQPPTPHAYG